MKGASLVKAGVLDVGQYRSILHDAARRCGLPESEATDLIESALEKADARVITPRQSPDDAWTLTATKSDGHHANGNGTPPPEAEAKKAGKPKRRPALTEMGSGERMANLVGDRIRHVHKWKKWLIWDGMRWKLDESAMIQRLGKKVAKRIIREVNEGKNDEEKKKILAYALGLQKKSRFDSMLSFAASEEGIPCTPDDLDGDHWLLNCPNGTLNLRTGTLKPHDPMDLITKLCPVPFDPHATCKLWLETLDGIFRGNAGLITFVQRLFGYILTGSVEEAILPIFYGKGANGKSTILETAQATLGGDYSGPAAIDFLMMRSHREHPTEIASLFGRRLVLATETGEDCRLNEVRVKALTGTDRLTARRMREDEWTFAPTHKLVLSTNHQPVIVGTDPAIWRRVKMVPFDVQFRRGEGLDLKRVDKLRAELPGVLAWMVRGCLDWQKDGLTEPPEVIAATAEYKTSQDSVQIFVDACCVWGTLTESQRRISTTLTRSSRWIPRSA